MSRQRLVFFLQLTFEKGTKTTSSRGKMRIMLPPQQPSTHKSLMKRTQQAQGPLPQSHPPQVRVAADCNTLLHIDSQSENVTIQMVAITVVSV
jgi:hypothetical protein